VPVLDAAAFHVMGTPDVVTLHIQYWVFGVGFFWSLAGLLSPRVSAWILWPLMLLALTAPRIGSRLHIPEADLLLDYLFVSAALLMFLWLAERERWVLTTAGILLCGVVLTKREGLLLTTVLIVATLLAGGRELRMIWRPLGLTVAVIIAVAIPWRIWYITHGVEGEAPAGGLVSTADTERLWPSLYLAVRVLFDTGYWSVITLIAAGALVLGAIARAWTPVVFFGSLVTLVTLGGGWIRSCASWERRRWRVSQLPRFSSPPHGHEVPPQRVERPPAGDGQGSPLSRSSRSRCSSTHSPRSPTALPGFLHGTNALG
jgi:hypothetical protein